MKEEEEEEEERKKEDEKQELEFAEGFRRIKNPPNVGRMGCDIL